ncbi:hypothetical protein FFLO_05011 [Filobasidium floriforme]|uniref:Uncharacterized protein n=1 Tax=Filobasidium floriforme TaxID=5210 RepID=A0A8K0JHS4_9TREE|nr:oxidoreductase [Filobasidium floriforme]KAG7530470.1 hypothetical protein FFLO_05011 [Filobasidium floriforme]KAH8087548.1 oxidoreductase [Filobasidium floriforme]
MSTAPTKKLGGRTAIVGCGSRGQLFLRGVVDRIKNNPANKVVAFCDINKGRVGYYNRLLQELGQPPAAEYTFDAFTQMLTNEQVEVLVVTTVDATHDRYIIPALQRGIRVLTEKPMTTDIEKSKAILRAVRETGNRLTVTFNYRFNPVHEQVYKQLASGVIGKPISVHFEWLLDTVHGADYFRRWHRLKDKSGGLMVHKSGHHFDLVNWWLQSTPKRVFGMGRLGFYGQSNGQKSGWAKDYDRAMGSKEAEGDPFALHIDKDPVMKELYVDNEQWDGYQRDQNVFAPGITIEDDMSVLVQYKNGVTMTYHLTAYSPWEGYRVMFNGDKGRLELEVVETQFREIADAQTVGPGSIHGTQSTPNAGGAKISIHPLWKKPYEIPMKVDHAGHGGGDRRLLNSIFGAADGDTLEEDSTSNMAANEMDGAYALAVGLAANQSFGTGQQVDCEEMLAI